MNFCFYFLQFIFKRVQRSEGVAVPYHPSVVTPLSRRRFAGFPRDVIYSMCRTQRTKRRNVLPHDVPYNKITT